MRGPATAGLRTAHRAPSTEVRRACHKTTALTDSGDGTEVTTPHAGVPDAVPPADDATGARMALANPARYVEALTLPAARAADRRIAAAAQVPLGSMTDHFTGMGERSRIDGRSRIAGRPRTLQGGALATTVARGSVRTATTPGAGIAAFGFRRARAGAPRRPAG